MDLFAPSVSFARAEPIIVVASVHSQYATAWMATRGPTANRHVVLVVVMLATMVSAARTGSGITLTLQLQNTKRIAMRHGNVDATLKMQYPKRSVAFTKIVFI